MREQRTADCKATIHEQFEESRGIGKKFPKFTGKGDVGNAGDIFRGTMAFDSEGSNEVPVHNYVAAVRVKMPLGELDGFADHDSHGDICNTFFISKVEGIADVIAVMDEGLRGKIGEAVA